jgi:hypothetical protein
VPLASVVYFFKIVQVDAFEFNGPLGTNSHAVLHHQSGEFVAVNQDDLLRDSEGKLGSTARERTGCNENSLGRSLSNQSPGELLDPLTAHGIVQRVPFRLNVNYVET